MTCRDCQFFDVERVKDKIGRIRRNLSAPCKWVSTEAWPDSVSKVWFKRPSPGFVTANSGKDCPCFLPRNIKP